MNRNLHAGRLLVAGLVCICLSACVELKQAGSTIGHTSKDVAREIGHASRDVASDVSRGAKRVYAEVVAEEPIEE